MKADEFKKQSGYDLKDIIHLREIFVANKRKLEGQWRVLDAYDSGVFWETLQARLPKHQVIPDTNLIFYTKDNQINSVYSAPYIADVLPIDPDDVEEARNINKFIEYKYNEKKLGYKQLLIAGKTALLNVGFLQVGWNDNDIEFTVRDPMGVALDPNYVDFQEGRAVFIDTEDSIENLKVKYPSIEDDFDNKLSETATNPVSKNEIGKNYSNRSVALHTAGMLPVWIAFKKVAEEGTMRIDQIIYTINEVVLDYRKNIKPSYFPINALYGLPPSNDPYGVGLCQRLLRNTLSVNILDSIAVTHTYASQRTPYVFDMNSGLSLERVRRDINNPDVIFPINNGMTKDVLHRMEYPALPERLELIRAGLLQSIEKISGIDEKYTGRDTASVTTTGGMERLQQRISMSDNTRIAMIEQYATNLSKMMLDFYIEHGDVEDVVLTNSKEKDIQDTVKIDFGKYRAKRKRFLYSINASPLLPKNRARLAEAANIIMQTQMQYGIQGDARLLSEEEWLYFQDFAQKDMILDRMKFERMRNDREEIASELASFGAMTEEGMRPEAAIEQLAQERQLRRQPNVQKNILQNQQQ